MRRLKRGCTDRPWTGRSLERGGRSLRSETARSAPELSRDPFLNGVRHSSAEDDRQRAIGLSRSTRRLENTPETRGRGRDGSTGANPVRFRMDAPECHGTGARMEETKVLGKLTEKVPVTKIEVHGSAAGGVEDRRAEAAPICVDRYIRFDRRPIASHSLNSDCEREPRGRPPARRFARGRFRTGSRAPTDRFRR